MAQILTGDLDELARFREEWKKEVERKRNPPPSEAGPSSNQPRRPLSIIEYDISEASSSGTATPGPSSETIAGAPSALTAAAGLINPSNIPAGTQRAIAVYSQAVKHEQEGQLDTALSLYRAAFRMDPNVDRAYHTQEMLASINTEPTLDAFKGEEDVGTLTTTLQRAMSDLKSAEGTGLVTGTLATMLDGFPEELVFEPDDEEQPIHLNILPEELFIVILRKLDHTSIERFGAVSRKARVLTLDTGIWRELVLLSYKPPQIPRLENVSALVTQYQSDFRRVYIEHPRIRLDGVYIAVCHYVRPGLSENTWVNISHLITYHRFLRFFPDGKVLSLLANEETPPAQVVHTLKPSLRKKGLFIGTWKLSGSVVYVSNLVDASGRFAIPPIATTVPGERSLRYTFSMTLSLRSRPLGRWNKLDITSYNSVDIEDGTSTPLGLRHERPFWFSRVRSFPPF
ncbi:hypothetical protein R3P38DRAFT_2953464 [Favolaschia claudopus]|uniref:F-box domain-containing protein n=1 Tax=Favolaschia claudopus TaxID=2862362 RepID=A0AAW0BJ49_9AGAR